VAEAEKAVQVVVVALVMVDIVAVAVAVQQILDQAVVVVARMVVELKQVGQVVLV
jgi:hypothetical protein